MSVTGHNVIMGEDKKKVAAYKVVVSYSHDNGVIRAIWNAWNDIFLIPLFRCLGD